MSALSVCPNCHRKPSSGCHFPVYQCKDCKGYYCKDCGGNKCPHCYSTKRESHATVRG